MKNDNNIFVETFPIVWIYTFIGTLLLWLIVNQAWGLSFLLGSVVSLMMMSVLYRSNNKFFAMSQEERESKTTRHYVLKYVGQYMFRYLFYAVVLIVATQSESLDVLGVGIGLFSFKICLYFNQFVLHRGDKND